MEIYKDVDGFGNRYQVTSWGRVYDTHTEKFLSQFETEKGYLRVDLVDVDGKRTHHKVHRLVTTCL